MKHWRSFRYSFGRTSTYSWNHCITPHCYPICDASSDVLCACLETTLLVCWWFLLAWCCRIGEWWPDH